jgi:L-ascorbate metabolism protein UlaG (beta-lactamase superfamily)
MATTVTRVTHSCALLDFDGRAVLTDPWFSEKPGYYRGESLAYTPATLPRLSVVVASHDHFDVAAFSAYPGKAVSGKTVFFGADTLRIPDLDEVPRRFPGIDGALLPVNGLRIRPAFNRQVVMNAEQAAEYCAVLKPKVAVPIHYAFTAGAMRDRLFLKYDGTPERFQRAVARLAPATQVRVLAPGEPLTLED